jgi:hypothetical protein
MWEEQRETVHLMGGGTFESKFTTTKVPRQCPLVLLVKVGYMNIRHSEVDKVRWREGQKGK